MIDSIIGFTIAFLPLYFRVAFGVDTGRLSKNYLFLFLTSGLIIFLNGSIKSKKIKIIASLLMILAVVNQYDPFSSNVSAQTIYIISGLAFFIKYFEYDGKRNTQRIYDGMILGALIQSFFIILSVFGYTLYPQLVYLAKIEPYIYYSYAKYAWLLDLKFPNLAINSTSNNYAQGTFGNYNLSASYLCMTIPAFLTRKKLKYLVIFPIICLFFTHSFMGIGAFTGGVLYYTGVFSKIKMYIFTIISMLLFPFIPLGLDAGRIELWKHNLEVASIKHWIFGMGPGWFTDAKFLVLGETIAEQEHSVFMSIFNIYGLLGFALLFPIFYDFLKRKEDDRILSTILFIIFCNSYGHFSFHQSTVLIIIIPILALNLRGKV